MSVEERIAALEETVKKLESQTNFRLLLVALAALGAALVAVAAFFT